MTTFYDDFRNDPSKVAEADEWNDGMQSGEHYTALEIALADLADAWSRAALNEAAFGDCHRAHECRLFAALAVAS